MKGRGGKLDPNSGHFTLTQHSPSALYRGKSGTSCFIYPRENYYHKASSGCYSEQELVQKEQLSLTSTTLYTTLTFQGLMADQQHRPQDIVHHFHLPVEVPLEVRCFGREESTAT